MILRTFIALEELTNPVLKAFSFLAGCNLVITIALLTLFGKPSACVIWKQFEETKMDELYLTCTISLELRILLSLTGSLQKMFQASPKQSDQAMCVNVAEHSLRGTGR